MQDGVDGWARLRSQLQEDLLLDDNYSSNLRVEAS